MTHELVYTSAPRGVRAGATGYCTVAHTAGLPADLRDQLEGLSRYRHRTIGDDPSRSGNPVAYAHTILTVGYQTYHVLSRVADTGLDHTGRSNYLAHHIAFSPEHLPTSGPAWLCGQPKVFETGWDGPPEVLPAPRGLPTGTATTRKCKRWERAAGDAGWAGMLAAATHPGEPAYLLYEPGEDVLGLISEAMALLPPAERWKVTFNTYFTGATAGVDCQWRCVPADSPEAREAVSARRGVILRVDRPMAGEPTGPLVEAARNGVQASPTRSPLSAPTAREPLPTPVARDSSWSRKPRAVVSPIEEEPAFPEPAFPETDERAERPRPRPVAPPPPLPSGNGVRPLLLGICLGGMLFLVCGSLVELAAGRSLLRFASVQGRDELSAIDESEKLKRDLKQTEENAEKLKRDLKQTEESAEKAKAAADKALSDAYTKAAADLRQAKNEATEREKKLKEEWQEKIKTANAEKAKAEQAKKAAEDQLHKLLLVPQPPAANKDEGTVKPNEGSPAPQVVPKPTPESLTSRRPADKVEEIKDVDFKKIKEVNSEKSNKGELFQAELFQFMLTNTAKPKLRVYGLPEAVKVEQPALKTVKLKGPDGFEAFIDIDDRGVVILTGSKLKEYPSLWFGVIEVSLGNDQPASYRQLHHARRFSCSAQKAGGNAQQFILDIKEIIPYGSKAEKAALLKQHNTFILGDKARIQLGNAKFTLNKITGHDELQYSANDSKAKITMKLDGHKIIIDIASLDGVEMQKGCEVMELEISRVIDGLPNRRQVVIQIP